MPSNAWDDTSPLGSDLASSIDDFMRDMKLDVRERMEVQHYWGDSLTADGKHKSIAIPNAANGGTAAGESVQIGRNTDGSGAAGTLRLVDKDGIVWYIWMDADGILRRHPLPPTADGTVGDTDGTPIGLVEDASSLIINLIQVSDGLQGGEGAVFELTTIVPLRASFEYHARGGAVVGVRIGNPTVLASGVSHPISFDADGIFNAMTSATISDAQVSVQHDSDPYTKPALVSVMDFDLRMIVKPVDTTGVLIWAGLTDGDNNDDLGTDDTPTGRYIIAFRYGPNDDGWYGVCSDGTDQTLSAKCHGKDNVSFATGTKTVLRIRKSGGTVYFSIDTDGTGFGTEQSVSGTRVPNDAAVPLGIFIGLRTKGVVATNRVFKFSRVYCTYGPVDQSLV